MSDLIDLSTPDTKGLFGARLASPLIPVPSDIACDRKSVSQESCSLVQSAAKRESLDNNPFDAVLHKTTEYIQKKDDPFEVALERALKLKHQRNNPKRATGVDFADDFTPKHKRHIQRMKLNRTLDESLIIKDLSNDDIFRKTAPDDSMTVDLNNTKLFDDEIKESIPAPNVKVPNIDIQNADLSILNQSVLNDSLIEAKSGFDSRKNEFPWQEVSSDIPVISAIPAHMTLKVPKARRCVSQGEKASPKKYLYLNKTSLSVTNDMKIRSSSCSSNGSSIPCSGSTDFLNDAFFRSQCSENSVFSSLSNVSTISRSTLASSGTIYSTATSNGTINRSFIESSSEAMAPINANDRLDSIKTTSPVSMPLVDIATNDTNTNDTLMSDLVDRLSKLKTGTSEPHVSPTAIESGGEPPLSINPDSETPVITLTAADHPDTPNKLIDVDEFKPEKSSIKESSASSIFSDDLSSPDSVFLDAANKSSVSKSILQEAKALARTFEELALRTNSGSNSDDLMASNPSWTSELLPAFEEEAVVENLIELPVSPNINGKNDQVASDPSVHRSESKDSVRNESTEKELVKDLEAEFIEPEKKVSAATLLLDLKKLIKLDNNTEVNALLGNLEKALGIECKNNTQLLETYLCPTNNLAKSPQKSGANVDTVRNVEHENMEQSQEENANIITKSPEIVADNKDINLNGSGVDKQIDASIKCIADISEEPDALRKETIASVTNNEEKKLNQSTGSPGYRSFEDNDSFNEKKAADLLGNLGKLLNGKTEEQSVLTLLKTLGKVLSSAPNDSNPADSTETENGYTPIQQTPKKSKLKSETKVRSPMLMNSSNRRSLNAETNKQSSIANLLRRSISVTHSSSEKTALDTPVLKNKKASQLTDVRKRFPSDPGLITSAASRRSALSSQSVVKSSTGRISSITVADAHKEKSTAIAAAAVKNKLKKKATTADVVNKRGPLKAILPISNMQRKDSISKKLNTSTETVTPPKPHKIISSTPNSVDNYGVKKSPRKPVASSTPDLQACKVRKIQIQPVNTGKKRNISCDISPVVTTLSAKNCNGVKRSPKKENTLPSPRKTTPKRRPLESSIPKSLTSPVIRRSNSSAEIIQHDRLLQSPQRGIPKREARKHSPLSSKSIPNRIQQSPLKDINKLSPKVKPFNLISKLRRHSNSGNIVGKENNCI